MGSCHPALKQHIGSAVARDELIFKKSLRVQMDALVLGPLRHLQVCSQQSGMTLDLPYAILIDGLDECKGERCQRELLSVIGLGLLVPDLPFRIFLASRPEMAIRTALEPGGLLHGRANHLQLSDKYYAGKDMCRYLRKRLQDLSLRVGNPNWFTEKDIDTLVEGASGQFIYVATAFKYISEPRGSPPDRLRIVLTWKPQDANPARPFETLDILYTNILLNAKEAYEAVDTHHGRDFLVLFRIYQINNYPDITVPNSGINVSVEALGELLGLEGNAAEILISDLHSLVALQGDSLRPWHKSFYDFLDEETRAKSFFVPRDHAYAHLAKCAMQYITQYPLKPYLGM
ncbi:hypothetical protein MD484_g3522, partial [Candolleomyces efflorescens]